MDERIIIHTAPIIYVGVIEQHQQKETDSCQANNPNFNGGELRKQEAKVCVVHIYGLLQLGMRAKG